MKPQRPDDASSPPSESGSPSSSASSSSALYRVIWRWHFYAGLIVAPVVLVASITGAALVFEHALKQRLWPERYVAASHEQVRRPMAEQVAAARGAAIASTGGDATLQSIDVGEWLRSTTVATFARGTDEIAVAVDPYTSTVQATFDPEAEPFEVLLDLHQSLLGGRMGKHVVELATAWGVVLTISGLYLWWPRGKTWVWGAVLPRLGRGPVYRVLRDLHAVPAAWVSLPVLVILLSAFVFSATNGGILQWHMARSGGMPAVFRSPPPSTPVPNPGPTAGWEGVDRAIALYLRPGWGLHLGAPRTPTGSYTMFIASKSRGPVPLDGVAVDQYTGAHLAHFSSVDSAFSFNLMRYGYALHTGGILGTPTKVLALVACLVLAAGSVTGVVMWWVRRPRGRTGFPKRPAPIRLPKTVIGVTLLLGALIPSLGASILLILAVDWVVCRIVRRAARE